MEAVSMHLDYKQMLTLKTNRAIIKVAKHIINTRPMAKNSSLNSDMNHFFLKFILNKKESKHLV